MGVHTFTCETWYCDCLLQVASPAPGGFAPADSKHLSDAQCCSAGSLGRCDCLRYSMIAKGFDFFCVHSVVCVHMWMHICVCVCVCVCVVVWCGVQWAPGGLMSTNTQLLAQ